MPRHEGYTVEVNGTGAHVTSHGHDRYTVHLSVGDRPWIARLEPGLGGWYLTVSDPTIEYPAERPRFALSATGLLVGVAAGYAPPDVVIALGRAMDTLALHRILPA